MKASRLILWGVLLGFAVGCSHSPVLENVPKRLALLSVYAPSGISADFAKRRPESGLVPTGEMQALLNQVAMGDLPQILMAKGFDPMPLEVLATRSEFQQLLAPPESRSVASLVRGGPRKGWFSAEGYPLVPIRETDGPRSSEGLKSLCEALGVEGLVLVEVRLGYDDGWLRAAPNLKVKPVAATAVAVIEKNGDILYRSPEIGNGAKFTMGPAVVSLRKREIQWNPTSKVAYQRVLSESLSHTLSLLAESSH